MTQPTIEQIREAVGGYDNSASLICMEDALHRLPERIALAQMVLDLTAERDALKAKLDEALKVLASTDNRLDALRHRPEDRTRAAIRDTLAKLQGGDA